MNLFYEKCPNSININGKEIGIVTDFREIIRLIDMLKDATLSPNVKIHFIGQYFYERPDNLSLAIEELTAFIAMEQFRDREDKTVQLETEISEDELQEKNLFSFEVDYPYIFSAFLHDYGINIRTIQYMHWWEFRMLFDGLSEDTEIKQRIMYRNIDPGTIKDRDERRRIEKIQRAIALPDSALSDYDIGEAFGW